MPSLWTILFFVFLGFTLLAGGVGFRVWRLAARARSAASAGRLPVRGWEDFHWATKARVSSRETDRP